MKTFKKLLIIGLVVVSVQAGARDGFLEYEDVFKDPWADNHQVQVVEPQTIEPQINIDMGLSNSRKCKTICHKMIGGTQSCDTWCY